MASQRDKPRRRLFRKKPNVVYTRYSPNQSERTAAIRLLVLHSTESHNRPGDSDLRAIADYFATPSAQASSHVITDANGNSARCVPDSRKAWTQVAFNSYALAIEQIGFAAQGKWSVRELRETARWLARWSHEYGVPLQRGKVSGTTIVHPGVVTHSQLGAAGGGHSDPGAGYPVDRVIRMARRYRRRLG